MLNLYVTQTHTPSLKSIVQFGLIEQLRMIGFAAFLYIIINAT